MCRFVPDVRDVIDRINPARERVDLVWCHLFIPVARGGHLPLKDAPVFPTEPFTFSKRSQRLHEPFASVVIQIWADSIDCLARNLFQYAAEQQGWPGKV